MTILAIDTSCDETSVAVTQGVRVLSNVIASQAQLHQPYGGVFPTVAKQAHKENIDATIAAALNRAGVSVSDLDAIAVTQGPGLAPALEVGINKAKELAQTRSLPLIPVNHIEAHALSPLAQPQPRSKKKRTTVLPSDILSLVISGGHSEFILIKKIGEYQRLGWTIDDAAGECLDKVGRMLDLGYPAGATIEQFAQKGNPTAYDFPLPMTTSGDYNLSYSGLKTFARNLLEKINSPDQSLTAQATYDFCASFQQAVFRHLTHKLEKILKDYPNLTEVWLGGGVAANMTLRHTLRATLRHHRPDLKLRTPYTKKLCGDNAAMIGVVAYYRAQHSPVITNAEKIERQPKWKVDQKSHGA